MDDLLVKISVGVLFATISGITIFVYRIGFLTFIDITRKTDFTGNWESTFRQKKINNDQEPVFSYDVNFHFKQIASVIWGSFEYVGNDKNKTLKCFGSVHHDRIATLDYWNANRKIRQHGTLVLHLNDNSDEITGAFVGYGPHSGALVFGEIEKRTSNKTRKK